MKTLLFATFLSAAPVLAAEPTSTAAKAINALGIDLLRKAEPPDANALLSPYSIQSALAMAYAGADGVTREEMRKVLHFPKDDSEVTARLPHCERRSMRLCKRVSPTLCR